MAGPGRGGGRVLGDRRAGIAQQGIQLPDLLFQHWAAGTEGAGLGQQLIAHLRLVEAAQDAAGLTEALAMKQQAQSLGFKIMMGCMVGTSLAMAPSYVVARLCDFVDIDGPLLLKHDHPYGLQYHQGVVDGLDPRFWG